MRKAKKGWKVCRILKGNDQTLYASLIQGKLSPDIFNMAPAIMDQSIRSTDMVELPFLYEKGFRTSRYPMFGPMALYGYQHLYEAINMVRLDPANKAILECRYIESCDQLTWVTQGKNMPIIFGFNGGIGTRYADWIEPEEIYQSGSIHKLQEEFNRGRC